MPTSKPSGGLFVDDDICRQDYALFNMKISYEIISNLNVFLILDNITDTRYEINGATPCLGSRHSADSDYISTNHISDLTTNTKEQ